MPRANDVPERSRKELMAAVLERSASDAEFRSALLSDPKRTIAESFGIRLPEHLRIRFIEKDPHLDTLVVLPTLRDPNAELDGSALEAVSGGQDDGGTADLEGSLADDDSPW